MINIYIINRINCSFIHILNFYDNIIKSQLHYIIQGGK